MKKWMSFVWVALVVASLTGCYSRPKEEPKPSAPAETPAPPAPSEAPAPGGAPATPAEPGK